MPFQPYGVDSVTGWSLGVPGAGAGRTVRATAVTNAAGDAVFNISGAAFAAAPVCATAVETNNTNVTEARITARSATSVTVNVRSSAGINVALLGLTLLGLPTPLAGATVHLIAWEAGTTT